MTESQLRHLEQNFPSKQFSKHFRKNVDSVTKCQSAPSSPELGCRQRAELHVEQT